MEQGKKLQVRSSLQTSLAADYDRNALTEESELHDTHKHPGVGQGLSGARQSGERGVFQWHSLKEQGHFRLQVTTLQRKNLLRKGKKKKEDREKGFKKGRSVAQGLVFLNTVVKENCCQKCKHLSSP